VKEEQMSAGGLKKTRPCEGLTVPSVLILSRKKGGKKRPIYSNIMSSQGEGKGAEVTPNVRGGKKRGRCLHKECGDKQCIIRGE